MTVKKKGTSPVSSSNKQPAAQAPSKAGGAQTSPYKVHRSQIMAGGKGSKDKC